MQFTLNSSDFNDVKNYIVTIYAYIGDNATATTTFNLFVIQKYSCEYALYTSGLYSS